MAESYIPLYRKYRPQKFSDLVGQENVVKTLSNAINLDRVSHAYLFTGSRGTGKTSTARILAKSLNCAEGATTDPCGKCPSCIDIANSNSIDVIEIDAASNGSVEAARNLIDKVQFMPVAGKYKVYIIDEVHMLSNQAFNTLLKTLEEPPKNLVFILATTESHKVLTTIISRCQRFDFKRVNQDVISSRLKEIAAKEGIKINDKAVSIISRRCHGGMRDALGLLDQASVLSFGQNEVTDNDIISLMGSMSEDILFKVADCIADKDSNKLITLIDEIGTINEPVQIIRELINYFRNILFVRNSDDLDGISELIDFSQSLLPDIKAQSNKFETSEIVQIIEKLSECEKTLKNSSQQHLWLEVGLIGICHRHDIQVIKELESRIEKLEEVISSGNLPAAKPVKIALKPVEIVKPEPVEVAKSEPALPCHPEVSPKDLSVDGDSQLDRSFASLRMTKELIATEEGKKTEETDNPLLPPNNTVINLADSWKTLLENMESLPARTFFMNLSKPVEINSEKIVVTFKNESFIKQSREDKIKSSQLEKAAEKMFGTLPKILIRTPLAEDGEFQKKNEELKAVEPQKSQQISTSLVEEIPNVPKRGSQVAIDETPISDAEREIADEIEEMETIIKPVNLPEQAKLVVELFNGKVIDS